MKKIFFASIFLLTALQAYSLEVNFFNKRYSLGEIENFLIENNITYERTFHKEYNETTLNITGINQPQELTLYGYKINFINITSEFDIYFVNYSIERNGEEDTGSDLILKLISGKGYTIQEDTNSYSAENDTSSLIFINSYTEKTKKYDMYISLFMSIDK